MTLGKSFAAGVAGAVATNVLHEIVRRSVPRAPRVDLLGMQALAKLYRATANDAPVGRQLYLQTLAGDLFSNSLYFSLIGFAPPNLQIFGGTVLGVVAGLGAVALPPKVALSSEPTARTPLTQALTIGLYSAGGIVAGIVANAASRDDT